MTKSFSDIEFFVSPGGDDRHSGDRDHPLASLRGARDAVRQARRKAAGKNITVWFAGGIYPIDETVVFGMGDSAEEGCTITYSAMADQRPIFSGGVKIGGWRQLADAPAGLAAGALGNVYVADLPEKLGRFHVLFEGMTRLPRAVCAGFTPPARAGGEMREEELYEMNFPAGAIKNWDNLADVEISIIPWAPWGMNVLPLESVDVEKSTARVGIRGTYSLSKPMFGKFPDGSVFVENVLEGLNGPGKWAVNFKTRKIYLWPKQRPGDGAGMEIIAPRLTEMVRVEGEIDYDGTEDKPVKGLVFWGLTFAHADRYTWRADHAGKGLQHDWEMFDAPSAMMRFRGAEMCAVEACHFTAAGASGIRLDLHCKHNRVSQNLIENIGGVGILLAGYGAGLKDVNNHNEVTGNHIHHIGQIYWQSPGIFVWQSGSNLIGNNLISHTPYTALVVSGRIGFDRAGKGECSGSVRWAEVGPFLGVEDPGKTSWEKREPLLHGRKNLLLNNEIHDAMEVLEDGDGIYISGAGTGNIVRGNYIHDCTSVHMAEGIRCDDDQNDTTIERNILHRIGGLGTGIAIKGTARVINNIMASPIKPPYCGLLSLEHVEAKGSVIERNIFYANRAGDKAVRQGKTIYDNESYLRDMKSDFNLYHNAAEELWGKNFIDAERAHGIESNSVAADPLFVDENGGDFRLRDDSPALKLGFVQTDMKAIGLRGEAGPGE